MKKFFEKINATPHKIACVVTGGGVAAGGQILSAGGASNTILYVHTPYHPYFSDKYLGRKPEGYCNTETANLFAAKAYHDALEWKKETGSSDPVVGIGCTSSLGKITDEREGREHKIFISVHSEEKAASYYFPFARWLGRDVEEEVNAFLLLAIMGEVCGVVKINDCKTIAQIYDRVGIATQHSLHMPFAYKEENPNKKIVDVLHKRAKYSVYPDIEKKPKLLLPTSMNPLHEAHIMMANIASEMMNEKCFFELSLTNADKPPLSYFDISSRTFSFRENSNIHCLLTNAPTFVEKAEVFGPEVIFVIGIDTARRICDPRFYGNERNMVAALTRLQELKTKFICFARKQDGNVAEFNADEYPEIFSEMVIPVGKDVYFSDISSTQIRKERNK